MTALRKASKAGRTTVPSQKMGLGGGMLQSLRPSSQKVSTKYLQIEQNRSSISDFQLSLLCRARKNRRMHFQVYNCSPTDVMDALRPLDGQDEHRRCRNVSENRARAQVREREGGVCDELRLSGLRQLGPESARERGRGVSGVGGARTEGGGVPSWDKRRGMTAGLWLLLVP